MSSVLAAAPSSETATTQPESGQPHPQQSPSPDPPPTQPLQDASLPPSTPEIEGQMTPTLNGTEMDAAGDEGSSGALVGPGGDAQLGTLDTAQGAAGATEETQQWPEDENNELKRVKVYELIGSRWSDRGTAFCFGDFHDNEALLIARSEEDFSRIILTTTIRSTDVYQRQQDTLIVWTEPDGVDYALSFQDPEGCAEVWNFIEEVQRHMNSGEDMVLSSSPVIGSEGPEISATTSKIIQSGRLPQPQMGIIGEIDMAIKALSRTAAVKERVCEYIQNEDYIKALIDVFRQAEDLESLDTLHALCNCMQTILSLNEHSLYEHILDDEIFLGVVGMLEFDPEFPTYKANYREFLRETSHFHQPIPIRDDGIQRKVHHTYRLQFLKDVVLARAIDDSTFNVLNSCIIFNQIDIISHIQNDQAFLREIAGMFMDEDLLALIALQNKNASISEVDTKGKEVQKDGETMDIDQPDGQPNGASSVKGHAGLSAEEVGRRREVVLLIQQLCMMGKNVQLPARMALFRTLVDRGILFAVQWGLSQSEKDEEGRQMISASGEVLTTLLDHDLNGVRGHVLKQLGTMERDKTGGKKLVDKETVLILICRVLVHSRDMAVQSQVGDALKTMLEIATNETPDMPTLGMKLLQRAKDDPGIEKFLDYFYKCCIETLFRPFADIPEFKAFHEPVLTLSREKTNLFLFLCDLLSNFALQHSFRSHFFILSSNISPRVATLLRAKDKHLRLASFRFFRTCLKLQNGNIFKHIIKHDVPKALIDVTIQESRRDNLLSSSCLECFEFMRRENLKEVIHHCMAQHEAKIRQLAGSPLIGGRFKDFIARWEMNMEPPPSERIDKPLILSAPRRWGQGKLLEAEEEDYFNGDDDDDAEIGRTIVSTPPLKGHPPKRRRLRGSSIPIRSVSRPTNGSPRPPPLGSLVDYDDDGDLGSGSEEKLIPLTSGGLSGRASPVPGGFMPGTFPSSSDTPPASPRMSHRQVSHKPSSIPSISQEEEDDFLALARGPLPPKLAAMSELGAGSKRRRGGDDDDDELLERLANKAKRPSVGPTPEKENADSLISGKVQWPPKPDEGPKKIKLKLGSMSAAVAVSPAPTQPPSSTGTKDGDTG